MYINYNGTRKPTVINQSSRSLPSYIITPNKRYNTGVNPGVNPVNYTNRVRPNNPYYYNHPLATRESTSTIISPNILSKYPCLNPMYKCNYKISNKFLNDLDVDSDDLEEDIENDKNNILDRDCNDELQFNYEQRANTKNMSNKILNAHNNYNIVLLRGDVVNIDTKTLVFDKFDYKTNRHVFKELTSLKTYDYDLNSREYKIIIPSQLKYDIRNPPSLRKVCIDTTLSNSFYSREPILEIQNSISPMLHNSYYYNISSLKEDSETIVTDYVSPNDIQIELPCVIDNDDHSYNGIYYIDPNYKNMHGWPVYSNNASGDKKRFIFRYPVKFTQSGFVWVLQPISPQIKEWRAHAYGYGEEEPWLAEWGDTTIVNSSEYRTYKLNAPTTYTSVNYEETIKNTTEQCSTVESVGSDDVDEDDSYGEETAKVESDDSDKKELYDDTTKVESDDGNKEGYSVNDMCIIS